MLGGKKTRYVEENTQGLLLFSHFLDGFVIAQYIANFLTTLRLEVCKYSTLTTRRFTHLSFLYSMARQGRCKRVSGVIING